MALFRHVGPVTSIGPGATPYWQFWFGNGAEVGVAMATPNMLRAQINTELVAREHGAIQIDSGVDEGGTLIHYTVQIRNSGAAWMDYNLNVGNLL
jgi:hypothetical protein